MVSNTTRRLRYVLQAIGPRSIRLCLVVLLDKLQNKRVDILGVRRTQEVLPTLNNPQLRIGAVDEHLDLLLGVGDRVDCVIGTVDPQNLGAPVNVLSSPSIWDGAMLTGQRTSGRRLWRPSRSERLIEAIRARWRPSVPR